MADTKISQLPEATSINQTDILPVVIDTGSGLENRKIKVENLLVKATGAEVNAGTDDTKIVTPKAIADSNVVITDKTQVLTNKTLTSPVINTEILGKDSGGNSRNLIKIGTDDFVYIGDNNLKGFSLATKIRAYAYNSADYTLNSIGQKIRLDSKVYDLNNNFDIVNYKYIVPYTGIYLVNWSVFIKTNDGSASFWGAGSFIKINNTTELYGSAHYVYPNANARFTFIRSTGSFLGIFNQNDYIELWGYRDNYTAIASGGEKTTYLSIILLALI